jgi:hypothetical protein
MRNAVVVKHREHEPGLNRPVQRIATDRHQTEERVEADPNPGSPVSAPRDPTEINQAALPQGHVPGRSCDACPRTLLPHGPSENRAS